MATDPLARLLSDADRPLHPRPVFAEALLERVLAELEGGVRPEPLPQEDEMAASLSTVRPPLPARGHVPTGRTQIRGRLPHRAPGLLATAALVLLMLAGVAALVRAPWNTDAPPSGHLAAVPGANQASPAAPADELLVEAAFRGLALPAGDVHASLAFVTVAPGAGGEYPGHPIGTTAAVLYVRSGTMAISGDAVSVYRGSDAAPAAPVVSPVAGETILGPGDAAVVELGPERAYTVRNPGAEPLVVLEAWIVSGPFPYENPPSGFAIPQYHIAERVAILPMDATVTMRLTRATLAPQTTRQPADGGWQVAVAEQTILDRGSDGEVSNETGQPLEIVVLTAEFASVAATPVP